MDNIFIDPVTGDMWVAMFPRPLSILSYMVDRSYPVEGRIYHISLNEDEELPFSYKESNVEEIFETDGHVFGAVSISVYCKNKLLLGTIGLNLMFCDNVETLF